MGSLCQTTVSYDELIPQPAIHTIIPGGRQVEGSVPSIWALDKICASPKIKEAQASGKLTVLFDSGIRTGSDVIKAIALGAQGVLRKCLCDNSV